MTYRVVLIESEEGFAVGCPAITGCWSQGETREEALENIRDAIREVIEVKFELQSAELRAEGIKFETAEVDVMANA
jgi:predicted RNase H-like HicB family nuclease